MKLGTKVLNQKLFQINKSDVSQERIGKWKETYKKNCSFPHLKTIDFWRFILPNNSDPRATRCFIIGLKKRKERE